ncbi:MAG: M20/M25/M40 family metallo-hydrolase [Actinobacteria bacterium]|nr:M20/M25/M40 family metallo-hydrolase [Actinomycetota bacterium]
MRAGLDELRDLFVSLSGIRSPSLEEREIAVAVKDFVRIAGLEAVEDASAALSGCACGNLIVRIAGRGEGTPIALCAHLDTVPLDRAPTVIVENGVVRTDGETILGADDKAAVAPLLLVLRDLAQEPPAADVEFVFTVGEEIGLKGAKALDPAALAAAAVFVFDSEGEPGTVIVAAPTLKAVAAEFRGVAAHAGIEPQHGRSAILAAARALAAMPLGRIDDETTANAGLIEGGSAVNVVAERCVVRAEARSRDEQKLAAQVAVMVEAFTVAAAETGVEVEVDVMEDFHGYAHAADALPRRIAAAALAEAGLEARYVGGGGGSDANVFNARGLPALTLGVGFERVHSPHECISLERLEQLYRLGHALVRAAGRTPS